MGSRKHAFWQKGGGFSYVFALPVNKTEISPHTPLSVQAEEYYYYYYTLKYGKIERLSYKILDFHYTASKRACFYKILLVLRILRHVCLIIVEKIQLLICIPRVRIHQRPMSHQVSGVNAPGVWRWGHIVFQ
jgi:hypothetical protein